MGVRGKEKEGKGTGGGKQVEGRRKERQQVEGRGKEQEGKGTGGGKG